ncbi:MAG TPA: DUF885 domain-containing protein [Thermoanaerobaculia bacterium]
MITTTLLALALVAAQPAAEPASLVDTYLERYCDFYPSSATRTGRHDHDRELEDFSEESVAAWVAFNRETAAELAKRLDAAGGARHDRPDTLDWELLLGQAEGELARWETLERHRTNPLLWSGVPSSATVFLLVRDDLPLADRLDRAAARAGLIPRFVEQALAAVKAMDPAEVAPELAGIAAGQTKASATFYREGFAGAASDPDLEFRLAKAGTAAAEALDRLAGALDALAERATGSPRLGAERYRLLFRLHTGIDEDPAEVAVEAEAALAAKRAEAAAYARSVWADYFPEDDPPEDDRALLARMFERVEADRASSVDELVADYKNLVEESIEFVRERGIVTIPDPVTIRTERSPSFFVGQSVGGVYPAGPYAPEADTLFYLPTPPETATPEQAETFYRGFNHHFNVMITPHEMVPGHYLQLKHAALHPRKVRALFGDGVYVEGWGTFCERLMLDLGWGGNDPLDRLAHLKKQMENIARTVVDIRVHTGDREVWTRDEVIRFVRDEALQDGQFAGNMWTRAITSSPQITSYWLGYRRVMGLYEDVKEARGEDFDLRQFMDGMMEMGPVGVSHYRMRMLPATDPITAPEADHDDEPPSREP